MKSGMKRILTVALVVVFFQFFFLAGYQALFAEQVNWVFLSVMTLIMLALVGTTALTHRRLKSE
ncbi:hypothetical protein [Geomicrobium sp. JCM 19039]|uniref:hypothetical protein n=1 Tax=Geomicrobium sp. JCM 19039 TaxID=1460636 RepID=UPI00045F4D24|nr:hypothetical protein [Geomicrobium sp. JCM 19039]GAK12050.1 hypothetical protein JCM19039_1777 [Geomicrobium sp. JCM 19039]